MVLSIASGGGAASSIPCPAIAQACSGSSDCRRARLRSAACSEAATFMDLPKAPTHRVDDPVLRVMLRRRLLMEGQ